MSQLIISLCILCAYMTTDILLTAIGIVVFGLQEGNPYVVWRIERLGIIPSLICHVIMGIMLLGDLVAIHVVEIYTGVKHIAQIATWLITIFYVFVLLNNIIAIWEATC